MSGEIKLAIGNILLFDGDAIVNPANKSMLEGSGLNGAIHRAAGSRQLNEVCKTLGGCDTGNSTTTSGFNLPCKWIIHTVGPHWHRHEPSEAINLLRESYKSIFREANQYNMTRIAIPAISTGINGFPADIASEIAAEEVVAGIAEVPQITEVLMLFSETEKYNIYRKALGQHINDDSCNNGGR